MLKKYKIFSFICFFSLMGIGLILFICAQNAVSVSNERPLVKSVSMVPEFPSSITIAGEKIDLKRYDMHERYDRELTSFCYTHNLTLTIIKKANRYFPIVIPILKEEGVPEDFVYLMAIESSLNTRAISPTKAAGLWQLMPETAKGLGLEVNNNVDERYDIAKSTRAACKYLKDSYKKYGHWMTVAASYNGGQGRISKELEKQQADDVFDLWLVDETTRYPFRMMALKSIMANPYRYGFILKSSQLYKPIKCKNVTVESAIDDLNAFAQMYGLNYRTLKEFNPWLRDRFLLNSKQKKYNFTIPDKDDLYYSKKSIKVYDDNWVVD